MPADANPFSEDLFGAEHVRTYQETDGEQGYHWRGTTILLLTTTGRVSGQERTTPLIFRADGDAWVVVGSKGGAPDHPDWYKNLQADPKATLQVKGERIPALAHTATGGERARLWQLMAEVWPAYDEYQQRTEREIPIVVFERR
jgi:deazaflavin-dependent oxidoreductase (nitroreductase family)